MDRWIVFGHYQSCGNRGSVRRVWCLGCRGAGGVGGVSVVGGVGEEWVGVWTRVRRGFYVCVRGESGFSVYMAGSGTCVLFFADAYAS